MSYSVNTKCFGCVKKNKCVDEAVIKHAVYALHEIGQDKGHLGAGSVDLSCGNLEEPKVKDQE
jgi:hypothetical protein